MRRATWTLASLTGAIIMLGAGGCTGITSLFNEEFLEAASIGTNAASLPGDAPAVLVAVENRTTRVVQAQISYRTDDSQVQSYSTLVEAGQKTAQALVCPVTELTLGDVSDLSQIGAIIRLGTGNANDPFVEVEPFGILMKEEANYECGDSVTFAVLPSGVTLSGYQVYAYIQRAGQP
jgi:hypothetical protein